MEELKSKLYFPIASYFRFFARIRLKRWNPRILVVTGSNGKTTLLHLLEAQIGDKARFSHHANSAYGIPFDILDLHRKSLKMQEWLMLFLKAPLNAFKKPPKERIYVVEADTDRAGEGKFLAELLRPEVVLWVSVATTHGMNFDHLVSRSKENHAPTSTRHAPNFPTVQEAIAYDYGYFLEYCSKLAVINGDLPLEQAQTDRTKAKVIQITNKEYLTACTVTGDKTTFTIKGKKYAFPALLPEELFYSLAMCREAVEYFHLPFDPGFSNFVLPPGRSSILRGIQGTTIIDSSYNGNLASITAMLHMFAKFPGKKKWVVLGDMLELGKKEQEEHEQLADILAAMDLRRIILVGKRTNKYTYNKLQKLLRLPGHVASFQLTKDALPYIRERITGEEVILFKGSQSILLEGLIAPLLSDQKDVVKLPRQEPFWQERRKSLGL